MGYNRKRTSEGAAGMETMVIDKEKIKEDLASRNLTEMHRDLTRQRRMRTVVMSILLFALVLTVVYGTLENPFQYTLSNIGNFFDYRIFFIVWAIGSGIAIQVAILALYRLEGYHGPMKYWCAGLSTLFLVATAFIPANRDLWPVAHLIHSLTAGIYAALLFFGFNPFVTWVSRENPRLRLVLRVWLAVIWIGSVVPLILFGKNGLFEMWFFSSNIILLLYMSLVLFEERIVKLSVAFLKDEPNLNLAIEKYFIDLETQPRKAKKEPSE